MSNPRPRIGELLVSAGVLTQEKLDEALVQPRKPGQRLGELCVALGLVSETQVTQILGQQLSVPWVSLYHIDFSRQLLNLVPREVAEKYCLVPIYVRRVRKQGETLYVAMDDPTNEAALAEVAAQAGLPAMPMIACPSDIRSAIRVYYGGGDSLIAQPPAPPTGSLSPISPSRGSAPPSRAPVPPPPPPPMRAPPVQAAPPVAASGDHPDAEPEIEAREVEVPRRPPRSMVAMTMLDGTTLRMPTRGGSGEEGAKGAGVQMTGRDVIRALLAISRGRDPSEIAFDVPRWEELFAALLTVLMRKGLVADWEFTDELKKIQRRKAPTDAETPPPPGVAKPDDNKA